MSCSLLTPDLDFHISVPFHDAGTKEKEEKIKMSKFGAPAQIKTALFSVTKYGMVHQKLLEGIKWINKFS